MGDTITVLAYFNAAERADLYNTIAALTASSTMKDMFGTITMIAFVVMVFGLAVRRDQDPLEFLRWVVIVTFMQAVLVVPKARVSVVDRTGGSPPVVVDNVPLVLAFLGSATSTVGDALTRGAETVMALPDDIKFQRAGLMFGSAVFVDTLQAASVSASFRDDLTRFINNCTYYDILSGRIRADTLTTSADIWAEMATTSHALRTPIEGSPAGSLSCKDAYANLHQRWADEVTHLTRARGRILNPGAADNVMAGALLQSQIVSAYNALARISVDAVAALRQNMALNAVRDSQMIAAQRLDSASAAIVGAAQAQTEMTANLQYMAMARVAERATPRMRNVIEILCDFVFPIVVCLMILSIEHMGKILKMYVMSLAWVQLIPPLYAVLNFVMVKAGRPTLVGIASSAGALPAVNLHNIGQLSQQGLSDMAIAGYMSLFIPVIAWGLVKGGEVGGASLFNALGGPAFGAAGSTAGGLATGNVSQGNLSLDTASANNVNAHHYDVAPSVTSGFMRSTTAAGTAIVGPDGTFRFQGNQSSLGFTANFGQKIGNALTEEAASRAETARRDTATAATLRSAALLERMGVVKSYSDQQGTHQQDEIGQTAKSTKALTELNNIAAQINERLGLGASSDVGAKLIGNMALGTDIQGVLGSILRGGGKGANIGKGTGSLSTGTVDEANRKRALEAAQAYAREQVQARNVSVEDALADDFRSTDAFRWGSDLRKESISGAEASLTKSRQYTTSAERANSEAFALSHQASIVKETWAHSSMNYEGYLADRLQSDGKLGLFNRLYQSDPEKAALLAARYLADAGFHQPPQASSLTQQLDVLQDRSRQLEHKNIASEEKRFGTVSSGVDDAWRRAQEEIRAADFLDVVELKSDVHNTVILKQAVTKVETDEAESGNALKFDNMKDRLRDWLDRKSQLPGVRGPAEAPKPGSAADEQDRLHRRLFRDDPEQK